MDVTKNVKDVILLMHEKFVAENETKEQSIAKLRDQINALQMERIEQTPL